VKKAYPAGGILNKSQRDKGPEYYGSLEIDEELFEYLKFKIEGEGETRPRLELSGWKKDGNQGPFISLKPQIPYKEREAARPQKATRSREEYDEEPRRRPPARSSEFRHGRDELDDETPF
jgi:hypothetical protein